MFTRLPAGGHKAITMSTTTRNSDHSQNYEEFLQEIGIKRRTRAKAMKSKPTVMLSQENGEYVLATSYPEGRYIRVRFKPEVEIHRRRSSPNPARSVFHVLDNKLIEEQQVEDVKILIVRQFNNKYLLVTMEANNVKCYRWYGLVQRSRQSIGTETSRRSYLWETEPQSEVGSKTSLSENVEDKWSSFDSEVEEESLCY